MNSKNENELVRKLGQHRQSGQELIFETCPSCQDTGYHFYVNSETYQFYCFKCNVGGGHYGLAKLIGMDVPEDDSKLQELKEKASQWFRELLASDALAENARVWLERRGIERNNLTGLITDTNKTELENIPKFLPIGFYPGTSRALKYFEDMGYTAKEIKEAGLIPNKTNDTPYLVFTYHLSPTKISRFKLRVIEGPSSSCQWLGEGPCGVFGLSLYSYSKKDDVIGVEGEFDCLSLQLWTWKQTRVTTNVICLSGGAAGTGADTLARLGIRKLRLIPDNDIGGLNFVSNCLRNDMNVVVHSIPENYKDIDDYIQKTDKVDLQAIYESQFTPGSYLADGFLKYSELSLDTPDGIQDARTKTIDMAKKLSGINLNDFLAGIAKAMKTTPEAMKETLNGLTEAYQSNKPQQYDIDEEIEIEPGEALPDIPKFNDELIPAKGILRDYIEYMLPITEAPVQFHLFAGLIMLSTVIGKRVYFITSDDKSYCNLWAVLIGRSGCKKSTSIKRPRRILSEIDMTKYIFPTQVTSERLIPMLVENSTGTFFWSEWGATMDQWGKNYAMDIMSIFTELFDGGYFARWLKAEKYEIPDSCINLFCGCTYSWLKKTMKQADIAMGFWPRFLFIPSGKRERYLPIPPKGDNTLLESVKAQLKTMQDIFVEAYPQEAEFSQTKAIYDEWYEKINKEADSDSYNDEIASFIIRLSEYAKKIAILMEISLKSNWTDNSVVVKPETMEHSIKLCNWLLDTTKYVIGTVQKTELNEMEEKVYQFIYQAGPEGIQHRNLRHAFRLIDKGRMDIIVDSLDDADLIVKQETNTSGKGRRGFKYIAGSYKS